jgi:hypothetical protein
MRYSNGYADLLKMDGKSLAAACQRDPVMKQWLRPEWLDPRPLREQALARPIVRWAVADNFFKQIAVETLSKEFETLEFIEDDVGLAYHSNAIRADRHRNLVGMRLFSRPIWHAYASFVVAAELKMHGRTVVKYRSHPARSRGFWLHTDRDREFPKALAVLGYLNERWNASDGALLQLWETIPATVTPSSCKLIRWRNFANRKLSFLTKAKTLMIEAADIDGFQTLQARLLDQILPEFNRLVFLDFQTTSSFHSVSPSGRRVRNGFVQWLY